MLINGLNTSSSVVLVGGIYAFTIFVACGLSCKWLPLLGLELKSLLNFNAEALVYLSTILFLFISFMDSINECFLNCCKIEFKLLLFILDASIDLYTVFIFFTNMLIKSCFPSRFRLCMFVFSKIVLFNSAILSFEKNIFCTCSDIIYK